MLSTFSAAKFPAKHQIEGKIESRANPFSDPSKITLDRPDSCRLESCRQLLASALPKKLSLP